MISFLVVFILAFISMEGVAWFAHKYLMHGFLWKFHVDHHDHSNRGFFEKNDSFFLVFALPGMLTIILGSVFGIWFLVAIGLGITVYGVCYFLVHDVFIHQRFKWFQNANNRYFKAIRRAHKMHHKHLSKEDGECFGMLFVPFRYFQNQKK
jgi:beta-carotene 3-hydroxylase